MGSLKALSLLLMMLLGQTKTYENVLNEGLKAEGLRQWPEAISYYVQAIKLQPANPLPRDRVISIFRELKSQGVSTTELEVLLDDDLKDQLGRMGILKNLADEAASLRRMNLIFWGGAGLLGCLILAGFFWLLGRKRAEADLDAPVFSTRASPQKKRAPESSPASAKGPVKAPAPEAFKPNTKVTEKTKSEMTGIIANVKSLTSEQPRKMTPPTAEELQALNSSEVIEAIAQTMISDVSVEEAKEGKFAKMTIEAELIFDESDLPPDLEDYRKEHGDEGIEAYLAKLHQDEAKKKK